MTARPDRSIPELFGDAVGQLATLISNEFALVRAEVIEKVSLAGRAAAMMAAGAVLSVPAVVMLLFAAAEALVHSGISKPIAYLIVGSGTMIVSIILILFGSNRLSGDALKPTTTLRELERDKATARELMQ